MGPDRGARLQPRARIHPAAGRGRLAVPGRVGPHQLTRSFLNRRIDLAAVEASLRGVQRGFDAINLQPGARRDPLDDRVVDNMLAGYAYVDTLVADGIDLFAFGSSEHLLELNTLVLCGTSPVLRAAYARHIGATERRFYDEREGGIRGLAEWQALHEDESVWSRAAGAHVQILSKPQLFIEGNHRVGTLVTSYLLVRAEEPPFVLTPENAVAYFDLFRALPDGDTNGPVMLFRRSGVRRRLAALLREQSDRRYLLD